MSEALSQTEQAADRIRGELVSTLKELDRRRQRVFDARAQLKRHWPVLVAGAAGLLTLTGLVATGVALGRRRSRKGLSRQRLQGFLRAWEHPERLAHSQPRSSKLSSDLTKKLVLTVAGVVAGQLAQKASKRLIPLAPRDISSAGKQS